MCRRSLHVTFSLCAAFVANTLKSTCSETVRNVGAWLVPSARARSATCVDSGLSLEVSCRHIQISTASIGDRNFDGPRCPCCASVLGTCAPPQEQGYRNGTKPEGESIPADCSFAGLGNWCCDCRNT